MSREELLVLAREVALRAYCPYSHFRVGTALVAGGELYTGVNVEISSYGLSLCAERSALAAAISAGAGPITQVAVACIDTTPTAQIYCLMHSGYRGVAVAVATYALDNSHISCVRYKS